MNRVLKLHPALLVPLAFFISFVAVHAQTSEKAMTLKACTDLFGQPVDTRENLFEVNPLFVLQPKYDSRGAFVGLAVFPKYWLEETHPEWTEPQEIPLLPESEYANLLGRLDGVRPKGKLLSAGVGSVVTNMTEYFLDQYENAFVRRGVRADEGVRFVELYYSHEVDGKVEKKREVNSFGERYYVVLAGEFVYYVRPQVYSRLRAGKVEKFAAVGPIKGHCLDRHCNP